MPSKLACICSGPYKKVKVVLYKYDRKKKKRVFKRVLMSSKRHRKFKTPKGWKRYSETFIMGK